MDEEQVNEYGLRTFAPFRPSVDHTGIRTFERWTNSSIEEESKDQFERGTSITTNSSRGLFSPARSPMQENAGFFNRLKRMGTKFPLLDMSFLVGFIFTLGSAVFVMNGFFLLLPIITPSTNFVTEVPYATSASSVVGTVIFVIGGWVAVLEGLNFKRGGKVTLIQDIILEDGEEVTETQPKTYIQDQEPLIHEKQYPTSNINPTRGGNSAQPQTHTEQIRVINPEPALLGTDNFIHWCSWRQFYDAYINDLVWWGGIIQFIGTLIFAIATFTVVPGILDLDNVIQVRLLNLLPATLGGFLFLVAAIFQLIITQRKWWLPAPQRTEWWIGFWNTIGSLGFVLAGGLPFIQGNEDAVLCGIIADFCGSWAFLLGSTVQWYVVMGNYP